MPASAVIRVSHLAKRYGQFTAVRDVSFTVEEGEIFGILGPNGSGKTSTVESLQGLRPIDGGEVNVLGFDPRTHGGDIRRRIGSQLQESALPDRMRVWEALELFGSLSPEGPSTEDSIRNWGLEGKARSRFGSLSGGQKQRLFVALALTNDPRLVFLDEMTTGLDPASRRVTWELIRRIRERGTTVVLVTHFMEEAEALCDRVMVISDGAVLAQGTPSELIDRHGGGLKVRFTLNGPEATWLSEVPHVNGWSAERGRYEVTGDGPVLAHVASALLSRGHEPSDLRVERPTLEDTYLALTARGGSG